MYIAIYIITVIITSSHKCSFATVVYVIISTMSTDYFSLYWLLHILLQRWFVDGTVKCFEGGHLPLAILAMRILIFYVLIVSFIIAVVLRKIKVSTCT